MKTKFLIIIGISFASILPMYVNAAFGFMIHDMDYENSPYDNKKMPSLGKPVKLLYQVSNNTPEDQTYDVSISITNLNEKTQVYSTIHHYEIKSNQFEDLIWSFTPETSGLYLVKVIEDSKTFKYVFAVPKDDSIKQAHIENPTLLQDKNPLYQFRIGIDPKEIQCKDNLYLALRQSGLPVCVTLDTLVELRQRDFVISEVINYEKIGHFLSETQFQNILREKNIQYSEDNFLLIQGMMLPMGIPAIDYCGYALSEDKEDYWFSSNSLGFNLTSYAIHDENPEPCKVGGMSCGCFLQTSLTEKNLNELSYFDELQERQVGKIFADYLNEGGKITNVPNSFVIGKYNLEIAPDVTSFCGQFQGKSYWHFVGDIKDSKIINWGLEMDKPKLCAISDNTQKFVFNESAIVKDSFTGQ